MYALRISKVDKAISADLVNTSVRQFLASCGIILRGFYSFSRVLPFLRSWKTAKLIRDGQQAFLNCVQRTMDFAVGVPSTFKDVLKKRRTKMTKTCALYV